MKKTYLLIVVYFVLFILSSSATAIFTSSHTLKGTLGEETKAFFIGRTIINGSFTGQPLEHLMDSSFLQQMRGFPLIGESSLTDLDSVIVIEDIDITTATSLEDLIMQYSDHITTYTNVDIVTEEGLFLLGINDGFISLSADLSYAVTTIVPLEIVPDYITRFFVIGTNSPLTMQCSGDFAALTTLSDTSTIILKDGNGRTLWTGGSPNDYLIIQDPSFSLVKHPSLSLLPLTDSASAMTLTESVVPAAPEDIQIKQLIQNVAMILEDFSDTNTDFLESINDLDAFIETSSFIANGAMILQQTNDTVTIDHSSQRFSSAGFIRFNTLSVTNFGSPTGLFIKGDCALCYLGDHFYNPSAKRSNDGIAFPYELLFIWVLSLGIFVYVRFFLRPLVDITLDQKIRRYGLVVHISALVIAFLLLDLEVNILFGMSALSSLVSQGFSMGTGAFFLLEALIWIIGFCILAIPLQLLSYAILRYLGVEKGGNGIWKAVGDLSIWVFSGFYLLLFFNILLLVIDFNSLFAMG